MPGPVGEPLNVYSKNAFHVEVSGIRRAAFSECSELSVEVAVQTYFEGGRDIPHKKPSRRTFADVTLSRGATGDPEFYDWMDSVAGFADGLGAVGDDMKRTLDIVELDADGSEVRRHTLFGCFPTKHVVGESNADSDDPQTESLTLAYDYFERS